MKNNSKTRPYRAYADITNNNMSTNMLVQLSHLMISTGVNEGQNYAELAVAIGQRIRFYFGLNERNNSLSDHSLYYSTMRKITLSIKTFKEEKNKKQIKFKSKLLKWYRKRYRPSTANDALQLGAFVLNAYIKSNLVIVKLVTDYSFNKAKTIYKVYSADKTKLRKLRKEFDEISDPYKPLLKQANDWKFGLVENDTGEKIKLIKEAGTDTLSKMNNFNTPIVLNAMNKKQKIAYVIDQKVFETYKWALKTGQNCFEHNSVDTIELDRKAAKKREAQAILEAAEPYVGKTFYQQYQADNRGRLYPLSAYLNELNSDNAKGMLKFAQGSPLGESGKEELFHHIANMWGEDKIPHKDKIDYVEDRYSYFASMGSNPKEHKGWMDAEEPFQFLQSVIELDKLQTWENAGQGSHTFVSHTICYRDGSNNGLQWLFSLAKDEQNAHLANVKDTGTGKPGDMYQYVANAVIQKIGESDINNAVALENYDKYFKTIELLRNRCRESELKLGNKNPISERKRKLIKWYQRRYKEELKTTDLLYWNKAQFDPKTWRKIVKRNVMTYGYSATKQGMGEQIIQDTRDIDNEYLSNKQHSAARLLGGLVYKTIEEQFPKVNSVMKLFKDNCGLYMKSGRQYQHKTIINSFPFTQRYIKYNKGRVFVDRVLLQTDNLDKNGNKVNEYKIVEFVIKLESHKPNIAKAKAGISPNTIHNLDSLHLMLVIDACNFDIVSAHDSYGARAGDIQVLNKIIREQFKRIIDKDPINNILDQTGNLVPMLETGKLDSSEILNSEFAFA